MKRRDGFTVTEILVVMGITLLLTTLAITYNRSTDKQLIIFRDQAVMASAFNRAKALAIERFNDPPAPDVSVCAFGLHFERGSREFVLFQDLVSGDCASTTYEYSGASGNEHLDTYTIDPRLEFYGIPVGGLDIVFIPPELEVSANEPFPITITIQIIDGSASADITISASGQVITTQ